MISGNNNVSTVAKFDVLARKNPSAARALFFGDSWFQYPGKPIDLNKQISRHFRRTAFLNLSVAGRDSASWKRGLPSVQRAIQEYRFQAILLSCGGNDIVGDELAEFVKRADQPQACGTTEWGEIPAAVRDHVRLDRFHCALNYAIADFQEVIDCRNSTSPTSIVYLHTYDYVYPSGKPFTLGPITAGPWVKDALDQVGLTDAKTQRVVTTWLLDQFACRLRRYASVVPNIHVIDSRNTLRSAAEWADEIHPNATGFARIAKRCWLPQLTGVLA